MNYPESGGFERRVSAGKETTITDAVDILVTDILFVEGAAKDLWT